MVDRQRIQRLPDRLHDIGAVNYYADIKCFDLIGLANNDVFREKNLREVKSRINQKLVKEFSTRIAVIYDFWFHEIPPEWERAGEWEIRNNIVCGAPKITFYAVDKQAKKKLINDLRTFSSELPEEVIQSGEYLFPNKLISF